MRILLLILLSYLPISSFSQAYKPSDIGSAPLKIYPYQYNIEEGDIKIESYYVEMRDGVKIALDLYLPKNLTESVKLPTILFQTRYWRSIGYRWPVSMFLNNLDFNGAGKSYIKKFINNGYAFVSVDVRGSGASTGIWHHPFHENEIKDGSEIINWIVKQSWSNGRIGTFGRSYSGSAAEFILTNHHPAIKASMPMYAPFDVFDDIGFPGGVHNEWYTTTWGQINTLLDQNTVPIDDWKAKLMTTGVAPVKGQKNILKQAIREHVQNIRIDQAAKHINFRDDEISNQIKNIDVISPYTYLEEINRSMIPIYSYSGWMDGGYQHAAIKRYLNLSSPFKKLIIGPWNHMGKHNVSPANPGKTGFDHFSEILKFFDYHLKGIETGIYNEYPIHYFIMGEEKWKGTQNWPPDYLTTVKLYLTKRTSLSNQPDIEEHDHFLKIDTIFGVGQSTRWEALAVDAPPPPLYEKSFEYSNNSLVFSTKELQSDTELTGHPILQIRINAEQNDLSLLVYLEDVDTSGKTKHITEGHFRAIHRKLSEEALYKDVVPQHSYLRKDQKPLIPNEWATLTFDLLPTSYLFKKGHKIQLRILSGDSDHFENYNKDLNSIKISTGGKNGSLLILPIHQKSN